MRSWGTRIVEESEARGGYEMRKAQRRESEKVKAATKKAMEYMDYILEVTEWTDYVEIVGKMGGDTITQRFYDNGLVTER